MKRNRWPHVNCVVATLILCCLPLAVQGQTFSFTPLGFLSEDDISSAPTGVSADGSVVVGRANHKGANPESFFWTETGGMVGLGILPGGAWNEASAVSANGSVVVGSGHSASGVEAYRWTSGGGMVGLGKLPHPNSGSGAYGVSADGSVVVGGLAPVIIEFGSEAFRWTESAGMVGLGYLPGDSESTATSVSADGSVIVGHSLNEDRRFNAFRWTESTGMVPLGNVPAGVIASRANAVSADGSVVVGDSYSADPLLPEAFRWTDAGGMVGLGFLPGDGYSLATAVSVDGSVIVGRSGITPFVWTESGGMIGLQDLLTANGVDLTDWSLWEATGISADGRTIVGWGVGPNKRGEAWVATIGNVPEPSAYVLALSGAVLVAWPLCRRRRKGASITPRDGSSSAGVTVT